MLRAASPAGNHRISRNRAPVRSRKKEASTEMPMLVLQEEPIISSGLRVMRRSASNLHPS